MPRRAENRTAEAIASVLAPGQRFVEGVGFESPGIERGVDGRPRAVRLPSLAALAGLPPEVLLLLAQQYGITLPWSVVHAQSLGRAAEMATLPASIQAAGRIIDRHAATNARSALGLARNAQRRYQQAAALDGAGENAQFIRISEGDEHVCDPCADLAGEIGTLEYHEEIGFPGAASCDGRDNCRCTLTPVEGSVPYDTATEGQTVGLISDLIEWSTAIAAARLLL
jgi:hypothetical protein